MEKLKSFKKGDIIYRQGDESDSIYLIQSGLISLTITRGNQTIEVYQVSTGQVLGEQVMFGLGQYTTTATAINDTRAIVLPGRVAQGQFQACPQIVRLLIKSMAQKQKQNANELKQIKLERDNTPCPADVVSKVFGVIYHCARYTGDELEDGQIKVGWQSYKAYAQRIFGEPPRRIEQAIYVLVKLDLAEIEMIKEDGDDDEAEILGFIYFKDLQPVEKFFEFYAHYFFKSQNTEVLKTNEQCIRFVTNLLRHTKDAKVDRRGVCSVNMVQILEKMNEEMNRSSTDFFGLIEQKGLFVKRRSGSDGGTIEFNRVEFSEVLGHWKILREIESWNKNGFVQIEENQPDEKGSAVLTRCPECENNLVGEEKFCPNCGENLQAHRKAA